jgi:multidrug efflux pump subunit AcrA (membrane-fusion protein)
LFLPIWRDSVAGRFVLEPESEARVRTTVPGLIAAVYVGEGQQVSAGAPLLVLRNFLLQSQVSRADADYSMATQRATAAVLRFGEIGATAVDRDRLRAERGELAKATASLDVLSPISGTVLTPRIEDRLGAYVKEGSDLLEVADLHHMRARIYVSEYDLYKCKLGAPGRAEVDGIWKKWAATAQAITPVSSQLDPSIGEANKLKGLNPPNFYLVDLLVENADGSLKPGMTGLARIYAQRRSLAGLAWESTSHFFARKLW